MHCLPLVRHLKRGQLSSGVFHGRVRISWTSSIMQSESIEAQWMFLKGIPKVNMSKHSKRNLQMLGSRFNLFEIQIAASWFAPAAFEAVKTDPRASI